MYLLLKILYNLSIPNYCYLSGSAAPSSCSELWVLTLSVNTYTVLCSSLNMHLWQVSLVGGFWSLVSVTSGGAPCFNVADSWNGAIFWDRSGEMSNVPLHDVYGLWSTTSFLLLEWCNSHLKVFWLQMVMAGYSSLSVYRTSKFTIDSWRR